MQWPDALLPKAAATPKGPLAYFYGSSHGRKPFKHAMAAYNFNVLTKERVLWHN